MRALLALLLLGGCSLALPETPCSSPDDCPLPHVCCQGGPAGDKGAICFDGVYCGINGGRPMPVFPTGTPCGRSNGDRGGCRDGLVCCERTLTCSAEADCAAAPIPAIVEQRLAPAECGSDADCADGVCCGITWTNRAGRCSTLYHCALDNGFSFERPDAGAAPEDAGAGDAAVVVPLPEQICDHAYCDANGERAPTATERAACLDALRTGVDAVGRPGLVASEACLDAVLGTRTLCPTALRWRSNLPAAIDQRQPVFPSGCYDPQPARTPLGALACQKLLECRVITDLVSCEYQLAGLGYEPLTNLATTRMCAFEPAALGFAPPLPTSRCASYMGDCGEGAYCDTTVTQGGLCVFPQCEPAACARKGGLCDEGLCKSTCNPSPFDRAELALQCGGRVNPDGLPVGLACQRLGSGMGVCVPGTDLSMCMNGARRYVGQTGGPWSEVYQCKFQPGSIARFQACTPGDPDPCASGACIDGRCLEPCVVTPLGAGAPACRADEICAVRNGGYGSIGRCYPRCGAGDGCPMGMSCLAGVPGNFCRPD